MPSFLCGMHSIHGLDQIFPCFIGQKSENRRILCSSKTLIAGFRGCEMIGGGSSIGSAFHFQPCQIDKAPAPRNQGGTHCTNDSSLPDQIPKSETKKNQNIQWPTLFLSSVVSTFGALSLILTYTLVPEIWSGYNCMS